MTDKIIISGFADEYSHDPVVHAQYLKSRNVGYIEPRFIGDKNISDLTENEVKEYKKILSENGVKASSIGSPVGKINLADDFSEHIERTKRCLEAASILDAKYMRMFSFYLRDGQTRDEARGEVIEKLGILCDLAEPYGVTLCHENEAKIYGEDADHCLDLMTSLGGKLKCVFDMGNFVLDGVEPYPYAYNLLRDYIEYFHIKDSMAVGAIVPPGLGEANIEKILKAHVEYAEKPFFITLEPHLAIFSAYASIDEHELKGKYVFKTNREAFDFATNTLKNLLIENGYREDENGKWKK